MKIDYIAFDSFGVKSSCLRIVTKDVKITIDPGIALETGSFPLKEREKIFLKRKYSEKIKTSCKTSDIIVITHYHYDHYLPRLDFYENKILLIKDPKKNINKSQKNRAKNLLDIIKGKIKRLEIADGKTFKFGKTKIKFSKAVWHGPRGTALGKVIMLTIDDGKQRVLYSSDVDGPYLSQYIDYILKEKPNVIILDGAPTYLLGYIMSFSNLEKCVRNTIKLIEKTSKKTKIILDHHLLRDYRYRELYYEVYKKAKELKKRVNTAAEELGKEPMCLSGLKKNGPTKWKKWENCSFQKFKEMENQIKEAKLKP